MKKLIYFVAFFIFVSLLLVSCEEENASTGVINISLSADPVVEQYMSDAYLTITDIQLYKNDSWVSLEDFQSPKKVTISELTNGRLASLGSFTTDAGSYSKLRFFFDAPELNSPDNTESGCYVDYSPYKMLLLVPDNSPESWEAVGSFEVTSDNEVEITAVFNMRKSILNWSSNYGYILYPTFRLVDNAQVGSIKGNITNMPLDGVIAIYAYKNDVYITDEALETDDDIKVRFPNSVTNSTVNPDNYYNLQFLPPGTYDLVITLAGESGFYEYTIGIVEDVVVESNVITNESIDLNSYQ